MVLRSKIGDAPSPKQRCCRLQRFGEAIMRANLRHRVAPSTTNTPQRPPFSIRNREVSYSVYFTLTSATVSSFCSFHSAHGSARLPLQQGRKHIYSGGFSRAVHTEKAQKLALLRLERNAVNSGEITVFFCKILYIKYRHFPISFPRWLYFSRKEMA